ncbi:SUMF1/EgtB/PvdO family nonheme iron enzyme [Desulfobacterales bacterium HSG17]|nr:SUMF1/EgtB/PvdO family nonheme iron enzyme [Desulfobacterales bacterium HSG17]
MAAELISFGTGLDWVKKLWGVLGKSRVQYKKELEEINDIIFGNPLDIAEYYIEPDCQDINPADHHEEQSYISREPIMKKVDMFFQDKSFHQGDNQLFILSDAGMGKTALLTMLKLMHLTAFWPQQKKCVLKKLGHDTLKELKSIENRMDTILLLDSLDEDASAYGRVKVRLLEILKASQHFYKVMITCRTQFFPNDLDDDHIKRPGFVRVDEFACPTKYLSFFSDEKVEHYLDKRFPKKFFFWKDKKRLLEAQAVINKMGSLRCRPMLLSYIEDLVVSPSVNQTESEFHVYDALVKSWLAREKGKISSISEKALLKACIILATIMLCRGLRSISEHDLDSLIAQVGEVLPVKLLDIKGRSLINRNSEGAYRFSHYSIQEFCVAKLLLEKPVFKKPKGKILVTDFIFRQIASSGEIPNFIEHLDFKGLNFNTPELKDLRGLRLPGVDLKGKNLSGVDLSNADLSNSKLKDCKLTGTIFKNARLKGVKFEGSDYWNANVDGAELDAIPPDKNDLGMEFVFIPFGSFMMGSPKEEVGRESDEYLHKVELTKGFFMQTTQVTVENWRGFAETGYKTEAETGDGAYGWTGSEWKKDKKYYWDNPGFTQDDTHPVTCISWNDVQKFIKWLNKKDTRIYRMPTEAEWEYACRAGTTMPYYTGDTANELGKAGWYNNNSDGKTHPVGEKESNKWGLYDMHGNVWEWCQDTCDIDKNYNNVTDTYIDGIKDPLCKKGSGRVIRGGSWYSRAQFCRSAYRNGRQPDYRDSPLGFRLVCLPGQP